MSFSLPIFNVTCNIWTGQGNIVVYPPVGAPNYTVPAQIRFNKEWLDVFNGIIFMRLCVPAGTDIRPPNAQVGVPHTPDLVECPAGTGRYYVVVYVDDCAKGFPNEYRVAWVHYNPNKVGAWPIPTP